MKTLPPVKEKTEYYDMLEAAIAEHLKKMIYEPLMKELGIPKNKLENSKEDLLKAILSGRITFRQGTFSGKLNSRITLELKKIGAKWDKKSGTFKLPAKELPDDVKMTVSLSESRFKAKMKRIDEKLAKLLPEEIADSLKLEKIFDASIYKIGKDVDATLKSITVGPSLTDESRAIIARDYTNNMRLYIKDFTQKEIKSLREKMQKNAFEGKRYESMISTIQKSYDVSYNKAKFLARQETKLLLSKYKETRYVDAGVQKYKWTTVVGSPKHPVREMHKALDGKIFSWNNPPVVNEKGERKHPGEDFGCRCYAIPIVEFKDEK